MRANQPRPAKPEPGHTWRDCGHRADYTSEAEHDRDCPAFDPDPAVRERAR